MWNSKTETQINEDLKSVLYTLKLNEIVQICHLDDSLNYLLSDFKELTKQLDCVVRTRIRMNQGEWHTCIGYSPTRTLDAKVIAEQIKSMDRTLSGTVDVEFTILVNNRRTK